MLSLESKPLGWYTKNKIASNVQSYAVMNSEIDTTNRIYLVTAQLKKKWRPNQPTNVLLKLHSFSSQKNLKSYDVANINLKPSAIFFPIYPTIGNFKKEILIAWQETGSEGKSTEIKYIYSPNGPLNFGKIQTLDESSSEYTIILPKIKVDREGDFHLYYQKVLEENKFTLKHSIGRQGDFDDDVTVVDDLSYISYGVFFPSIVINSDLIEVFYQNRFGSSRKDEIFVVQSTDKGDSYDSPIRLTNNKGHDFTPFGIRINEKSEWVWQGQEEGNWSIFYQKQDEDPRKLTFTRSNAYSPNMIYIEPRGRIVTWHDFRVNPSQIFGLYMESKGKISKPHNVSLERSSSSEPVLMKWKNKGYLFYLSRNTLYSKLADTITGKINIKSETHPEGVPSKKNKCIFSIIAPYDPSGIQEIAWIHDKFPNSIPEIYNMPGSQSKLVLNNLDGGNHYLHIRYKDKAGNESKVTHYHFIIDYIEPSAPEISSPTHFEETQSTKQDVTLRFKSEDDGGIQYYRYAFSTNRAASLKKRTKKNELQFKNMNTGVYFFKVRAVDIAGNLSDLSVYKVSIISKEDNILLYTNLVRRELREDSLKIDFVPVAISGIKNVFYVISQKRENPYEKGEIIQSTPSGRGQSIIIPMEERKTRRLYTVSIGFEFLNGKKSKVRYYSFEYLNKEKDETDQLKAKKNKFSKEKDSIRDPDRSSEDKVWISIKNLDADTGFYKVNFDVNSEYRSSLKGYSWQLTSIPQMPKTNEINSTGGPEYIYRLSPGIYYLSVKAVFKTEELNQKVEASYHKLNISEPFWELKNKWTYILTSFFILTILMGIWQLDRLYFYVSYIRRIRKII